MKIAAVRCHALRAPIEDAFYYSQGYYGARGAVLLEVRTDDGLSGWGDCAGDAALLPALRGGAPGAAPGGAATRGTGSACGTPWAGWARWRGPTPRRRCTTAP